MMFETSRRKMIKDVWFFRPYEIHDIKRGYRPDWEGKCFQSQLTCNFSSF